MNYTKHLRMLRNSDWLDTDDDKLYAKAQRVQKKLIRACEKERAKTPLRVGKYSGLTRQELQMSGTCETDWS